MFNACSIANKLCELHNLLYESCYDYILISKSWLSSMISDGLLDPQNKYIVMRYDRSSGRGGDVCVLIKKCHSVVRVTMANTYADLEIVVFDILDVIPAVRFLSYTVPHIMTRMLKIMCIYLLTASLLILMKAIVVIVGDINLPRITKLRL